MSRDVGHISGVRCPVSGVRCHISGVACHLQLPTPENHSHSILFHFTAHSSITCSVKKRSFYNGKWFSSHQFGFKRSGKLKFGISTNMTIRHSVTPHETTLWAFMVTFPKNSFSRYFSETGLNGHISLSKTTVQKQL